MPAGKAVTAKQARLKKEEAEKCTEDNAAACYDHTGNIGIGPVKVCSSTGITCMKMLRIFELISVYMPLLQSARASLKGVALCEVL